MIRALIAAALFALAPRAFASSATNSHALTAVMLTNTPSICAPGFAPQGVDAFGNSLDCAAISSSTFTGGYVPDTTTFGSSATFLSPVQALQLSTIGDIFAGDEITATNGITAGASVSANNLVAQSETIDILSQIGFGSGGASNGAGQLEVGQSTSTFGPNNLGVGGNACIGSDFASVTAPVNGLIVEGEVGIGITSPSVPLDVNGAILSNSSITAGAFFGNGAGLTNLPSSGSGISTGAVTTAALTGNGNSTSPLGVNSSSVPVFNASSGLVIPGNVGVGGASASEPLTVHTGTNANWVMADPGGLTLLAENDSLSGFVNGHIETSLLTVNDVSGGAMAIGTASPAPNNELTVSGNIITGSSVTAGAFFGNGAALTNLPSFTGGFVPNMTTFGSSIMVDGDIGTTPGTLLSIGGPSYSAFGIDSIVYAPTSGPQVVFGLATQDWIGGTSGSLLGLIQSSSGVAVGVIQQFINGSGSTPGNLGLENVGGNVTLGGLPGESSLFVTSGSVTANTYYGDGSNISYPSANNSGVAIFSGGTLMANAPFLSWDNVNHRLGIRTGNPMHGLDCSSCTLYLDGNAGNPIQVGVNGSSLTFASSGNLTIAGTLQATGLSNGSASTMSVTGGTFYISSDTIAGLGESTFTASGQFSSFSTYTFTNLLQNAGDAASVRCVFQNGASTVSGEEMGVYYPFISPTPAVTAMSYYATPGSNSLEDITGCFTLMSSGNVRFTTTAAIESTAGVRTPESGISGPTTGQRSFTASGSNTVNCTAQTSAGTVGFISMSVAKVAQCP